MAVFVDRVLVHAIGGNGGHGCVSIRREKFKPLAGPDGGNGGRGGSVILEVDPQETTLLAFHHLPHRRAENGTPGMGDLRQGRNGADLVLPVPEGTVVRTEDGQVLADLVGAGTRFVAAAGGAGGLGNAALASPRRKAPGFALLGEPGEEVRLVLELKSMADVALVGFPSAGKSSLISAVSAARPKVADYPFTTLVPHLGVVSAGERRFTVADVPGLIPGASEGRGLGLEFLRHIERCAVIVHVLDCATLEPNRDPISDLDALEAELAAYADRLDDAGDVPLMDRPRVVVLNKVDVPEARELAELVARTSGRAASRCISSPRFPTRASRRSRTGSLRSSTTRGWPRPRTRTSGPWCVRDPSTTPASPSPRAPGQTVRTTRYGARSRSDGCARPTSRMTRRSATSRTGSRSWASRRSSSASARTRGTPW